MTRITLLNKLMYLRNMWYVIVGSQVSVNGCRTKHTENCFLTWCTRTNFHSVFIEELNQGTMNTLMWLQVHQALYDFRAMTKCLSLLLPGNLRSNKSRKIRN